MDRVENIMAKRRNCSSCHNVFKSLMLLMHQKMTATGKGQSISVRLLDRVYDEFKGIYFENPVIVKDITSCKVDIWYKIGNIDGNEEIAFSTILQRCEMLSVSG